MIRSKVELVGLLEQWHHALEENGEVEIDVAFEGCADFEVYRPADRAYIWSRKNYCREVRGVVRYGGTERELAGVAFVDVNAGYHERRTRWRWAAGAGSGRPVRRLQRHHRPSRWP